MFAGFVFTWLGCVRAARAPVGGPAPVALDECLRHPEVQAQIRQAERDLSDDVWKAGGESYPVIRNVSRFERESQLARELLQPVLPQLEGMSAAALVESLQTALAVTADDAPGVADQFFVAANLAIIHELNARPRRQLEALSNWEDDARVVYGSQTGPRTTIGDLIRAARQNNTP